MNDLGLDPRWETGELADAAERFDGGAGTLGLDKFKLPDDVVTVLEGG